MTDHSTPEAGDIVWVDLEPSVGHEQGGRRPALVVSEGAYNSISTYALVCPITRNTRPWPFKVFLDGNAPVTGAVLADQVRAIDFHLRSLRRAGRIPAEALAEVRANIAAIIGIEAVTAAQGVDLRAPLKTSADLQKAHQAIREAVPALEVDRYMAGDLATAAELVRSGTLCESVSAGILPGLEG